MKRFLITGERDWTDRKVVEETCQHLVDFVGGEDFVFVHGHCPTGVDKFVDKWATSRGYKVERHPADWDKHGKAAGPLRNRHMASLGADVGVAFWSGRVENSGTHNCIVEIVTHGIRCRIIPREKRK